MKFLYYIILLILIPSVSFGNIDGLFFYEDFENQNFDIVGNTLTNSAGNEVFETDSQSGNYSRYFDGNGDILYFPISEKIYGASFKFKYDDYSNRELYTHEHSSSGVYIEKISQRIRVTLGDKSNSPISFDSSNININQWHHIAFRITEDNDFELYLNGNLVQSRNVGNREITRVNSASGVGFNFRGNIDGIALFNEYLRDDEILFLANTQNPLKEKFFDDYEITIEDDDEISWNKNIEITPNESISQGTSIRLNYSDLGINNSQDYMIPIMLRNPFFNFTYCKLEEIDSDVIDKPSCFKVNNLSSSDPYVIIQIPNDLIVDKLYFYEIVFGKPNDLGKIGDSLNLNSYINELDFQIVDYSDYSISTGVSTRTKTVDSYTNYTYYQNDKLMLNSYYNIREYVQAYRSGKGSTSFDFIHGDDNRLMKGTVLRESDLRNGGCFIRWQYIQVITNAPFSEVERSFGDCAGESVTSEGLPTANYEWYGTVNGNFRVTVGEKGNEAGDSKTYYNRMYTTDYNLELDDNILNNIKNHNLLNYSSYFNQRITFTSQNSNSIFYNFSKNSYGPISIEIGSLVNKKSNLIGYDNNANYEIISFSNESNYSVSFSSNNLNIIEDNTNDGFIMYYMRETNGEVIETNRTEYYVIDRRLYDENGTELFPTWENHHYLSEQFVYLDNKIIFRNGEEGYFVNRDYFLIPKESHISNQSTLMHKNIFFLNNSRTDLEYVTDVNFDIIDSSNNKKWMSQIDISANKRDLGVGDEVKIPINSITEFNENDILPVVLRYRDSSEDVCYNGHITTGQSCLDYYKIWDEKNGYIIIKLPENIAIGETIQLDIIWGKSSSKYSLLGSEDIKYATDFSQYSSIQLDSNPDVEVDLINGNFRMYFKKENNFDFTFESPISLDRTDHYIGFPKFRGNLSTYIDLERRNRGRCYHGRRGNGISQFHDLATGTTYNRNIETNVSIINGEGIIAHVFEYETKGGGYKGCWGRNGYYLVNGTIESNSVFGILNVSNLLNDIIFNGSYTNNSEYNVTDAYVSNMYNNTINYSTRDINSRLDFSYLFNEPISSIDININSNDDFDSVNLYPTQNRGDYIDNFRIRDNDSNLIYYDTDENLSENRINLNSNNLYDISIINALNTGNNRLILSNNGDTGAVFMTFDYVSSNTNSGNAEINDISRKLYNLKENLTITPADTDTIWGSSFTISTDENIYPNDYIQLPLKTINSSDKNLYPHTIKNDVGGEILCNNFKFYNRNYTIRNCLKNNNDLKLVASLSSSDFINYTNMELHSSNFYKLISSFDATEDATIPTAPDYLYYNPEGVIFKELELTVDLGWNGGVICYYDFTFEDGSSKEITCASDYTYDFKDEYRRSCSYNEITKKVVSIKKQTTRHPYKSSKGSCKNEEFIIDKYNQNGSIESGIIEVSESDKFYYVDIDIFKGDTNVKIYLRDVANNTKHYFQGGYLYKTFPSNTQLTLGIESSPISINETPLINSSAINLYSTSISNLFNVPNFIPAGTSRTYELISGKTIYPSSEEFDIIMEDDDVPRFVNMWSYEDGGDYVENLGILGNINKTGYTIVDNKSLIFDDFAYLEDTKTDVFTNYLESGVNEFTLFSTNNQGKVELFFDGIINQKPYCLDSVTLNSNNGYTCIPCNAYDPEGAIINTLEYSWKRNGVTLFNQTNQSLSNTSMLLNGDSLQCSLRFRDDLSWSEWYDSNIVYYLNNESNFTGPDESYNLTDSIFVWNGSNVSDVRTFEDDPFIPFCFTIDGETYCVDELGIIRDSDGNIMPYSFMEDKKIDLRFVIMGNYLIFEDGFIINGNGDIFDIPKSYAWKDEELKVIYISNEIYVISSSSCYEEGQVNSQGEVCVNVNDLLVYLPQDYTINIDNNYENIVVIKNESSTVAIEKYESIYS